MVFCLTPKFGIKATKTFDLAVAALIAKIPSHDSKPEGILYSVGTFGKENSNFTVGFGYGFVGKELAEKSVIILGYEGRISRRTAFVTESLIFPGGPETLISCGFRLFGKKFAVDLAFIIRPIQEDHTEFQLIPYFDFVYNF